MKQELYLPLLLEASEGDAYTYMKKVLASLPCANELEQHYGENWTREIFNMIRNDFVHSGCDVYFVPGLARILFGELNYESEDEDTLKVNQLRAIVRFITARYRKLFTRNLALIKKDKTVSEPLTFEQLFIEFGDDVKPAEDVAESLKLDLPILKEYYSNPEFDDYALQVRNELMYFYDVDIEDANWIVCNSNTADFMHKVWFKMNPEECAKKIADKLTINSGSIDKDAYSNAVLTEGSSLEVVDGKEDIGEHFKKYMKKKKAEKPTKKKTCCGC